MQFIRNFHRFLLNLYPKMYREEYGDEMQMVFNLSLEDAAKQGRLEFAGTLLREFLNLPEAILYEHLRERRGSKMTGRSASHFDFEPGSRNEILAALLPFLLLSLFSLTLGLIRRVVELPNWLEGGIAILMLSSFAGVFIVGFINALPRWFMPYLGFPLSILNLLIFNSLMNPEWRGFPGLMQAPRFIREFVSQGLLWSGLILLIILLIVVPALIGKFRPFYRRLRGDWTLLAFIIYGTIPFSIVLTFDDYQNEEIYKILSFVTLAIGGWFYLRNRSPWKRFWSLFTGSALSMLVAAIGKGILYAGPWPRPKYFTWQSEMFSTLIMWVWMALILLIPPALNLLPRFDERSKAA